MIQVTDGAKRYGHKLLFEGLNWLVTPKDRVGIVGGNGTGKTTLLKILAGIEPLDHGEVTAARGLTIGYLPQDGLALSGRSVFAECSSVFSGLRAMEQEMEALTRRMAEIDPSSLEYSEIADRFHHLESEFINRDGYSVEAQTGTVLAGLGFSKQDWTRRTEEFSGGWQMRIAMAKLLLEKPNLLLLDEPTNHLDLEAREWLEGYLNDYPHAVVLISHDRYFLDVTVNKIAEVWNKRVHFYTGNYESYLRQKAERRATLEAAFRNQQDKIQQLEAFINRFRYQATKAKQVQSRIKELERIERVEIPPEEKTIHFSFPQPKPSGRIVAEFRGVFKAYGEKQVLANVSFIIERGDRVALVGVNGAGKSTLIKLLAGIEPLSAGQYTLGHNVQVDYFAQDQYKELDARARLLDDLSAQAPRSTQTELRTLLGCFLFSEDDVFKTIGVLSGGERNRYALARLLLQPSNFLLLDEPTNHLDMRAKDVLLEALRDYTGTLVFVSHDRYFLENLATRVFEVSGGTVRVHAGGYADYVRARLGLPQPEPTLADVPMPAPNGAPAGTATAKGKRVNPIRLRQLEDRLRALEDRVARLESEIAGHEGELAVFRSATETQRVTELLQGRRAELESVMSEWEEVSATLADLQQT